MTTVSIRIINAPYTSPGCTIYKNQIFTGDRDASPHIEGIIGSTSWLDPMGHIPVSTEASAISTC